MIIAPENVFDWPSVEKFDAKLKRHKPYRRLVYVLSRSIQLCHDPGPSMILQGLSNLWLVKRSFGNGSVIKYNNLNRLELVIPLTLRPFNFSVSASLLPVSSSVQIYT